MEKKPLLKSKTNLVNFILVIAVLSSPTVRELIKSNPEFYIALQGALLFLARNIKSNILFKRQGE